MCRAVLAAAVVQLVVGGHPEGLGPNQSHTRNTMSDRVNWEDGGKELQVLRAAGRSMCVFVCYELCACVARVRRTRCRSLPAPMQKTQCDVNASISPPCAWNMKSCGSMATASTYTLKVHATSVTKLRFRLGWKTCVTNGGTVR